MPVTMTVARFRLLMLVSLVLLLGVVAADAVALYRAGPASDEVVWSTQVVLTAVFGFGCLVLSVAGFAGLYMLRCWGRKLSLIVTVAAPLISIGFVVAAGAGEPMPTGAISPALLELCTLAWGAVLALAYYSPVSSAFTAGRSPGRASRGRSPDPHPAAAGPSRPARPDAQETSWTHS